MTFRAELPVAHLCSISLSLMLNLLLTHPCTELYEPFSIYYFHILNVYDWFSVSAITDFIPFQGHRFYGQAIGFKMLTNRYLRYCQKRYFVLILLMFLNLFFQLVSYLIFCSFKYCVPIIQYLYNILFIYGSFMYLMFIYKFKIKNINVTIFHIHE